jgi:hypothetical protein
MTKHITPSLVVSCIALFVALGGSSYAAVKLNANSVGSREIKNGTVRLADLHKSLRPAKTNKLFRAAVTDVVTDPASGIVINVKSEPGIKGDPGAQGAQGAIGPAAVTTREATGPSVGAGGTSGATASCLPGEKITGGGARFEATSGAGGALLTLSQPADGAQAWSASYSTGQSTSGQVRVFALCAS